jgi:hypothetical protein
VRARDKREIEGVVAGECGGDFGILAKRVARAGEVEAPIDEQGVDEIEVVGDIETGGIQIKGD